MAQDITEKENTRSYNRPKTIDTEQFEYTTGRIFVYGGLTFILATLGVTYLYLLVQKIKN